MSRIIRFILEDIGVKFDAFKLKKYIDLVFILLEKTVVHFEKIIPSYLDFYKKMINSEIDLASIVKDDKILHIGCGSFPATSILLANKLKTKVLGIDKNDKAVKNAILCVHTLNLSNLVEIRNAEAEGFCVNDYDVIIFSLGVNPYKKILEEISDSLKKNTRILFRTSSSSSGEITEYDQFLNKLFKIKGVVAHKQHGLLVSILLEKK